MSSERDAVLVEGLSKRYARGLTQRTRITEGIGSFRRGARASDEFWALREVDLEVFSGEALGLIGRNGAGKSTLLKILAKITPPTRGTARIWGRVASLIEVGTGFHPELTGRENVFLSAAIHGLSRRDTQRRLDEIVEFSGIGTFLDTPVKRYSSGMYVRLGFSVATHLDPEVFLVDEVLAVGDAPFRDKCFSRLNEARRAGQTLLLVSHDLSLIQRVCDRVVWLEEGQIRAFGAALEVIKEYETSVRLSEVRIEPEPGAEATEVRVARVRVGSQRDFPAEMVDTNDGLIVEIELSTSRPFDDLSVEVTLRKRNGNLALVSRSSDGPNPVGIAAPGSVVLTYRIPPKTLAPGNYSLSIAVHSALRGTMWRRNDMTVVRTSDVEGGTDDGRGGVIGPIGVWEETA